MTNYVYVILETYDRGKELERFSVEKWKVTKPRLNPLRISYTTQDIYDETLKDFDRIIWDRYFNPITRIYEKIIIPFTTDEKENCKAAETEIKRKEMITAERAQQIRESREIRIQRKKQENLANGNFELLNKTQNEMNALIPMDATEFDAFRIWQSVDYKRPAGNRIEQIRKEYNMSWTKFIDFIDKELLSK